MARETGALALANMGSTPATAAPNRVGNSTCLSEWSNHLERFGALTPPGRETKAHDHRPWVLEACQPVGDGVQTCKSDEYRVRAWPEARGASGGPGLKSSYGMCHTYYN